MLAIEAWSMGLKAEVVGERIGAPDLVAPQPVQAGVDHDPVQPGRDPRVATERLGPAERGDHRVLEGVGGVRRVAGRAQGDRPEPVAVPAEQGAESLRVTGDVRGQQRTVVFVSARTHGGVLGHSGSRGVVTSGL